MTIPWIDQSSASFEQSQPRCPEPAQKGETAEEVNEKSRAECSDNQGHQKIFDPPTSESKIFSGLFPLRFNYLPYQEELHEPLFAPIESKEEIFDFNFGEICSYFISVRRFLYLGYTHVYRWLTPLRHQQCDPLSISVFDLPGSRRPGFSFTSRGIARLTFRLSLILFLLLAVDSESSLYKSRDNQTGFIISLSLPISGPPYFFNFNPPVGLQGFEVWSDPRRTSRTVGKHRCYCTKNSFFVSPHDPSESDRESFLYSTD